MTSQQSNDGPKLVGRLFWLQSLQPIRLEASARVAVLPCCHHLAARDGGDFSGWVDRSVAIDIMRAVRLQRRGYRVWTQTISSEITPKNRLLIGAPVLEANSRRSG